MKVLNKKYTILLVVLVVASVLIRVYLLDAWLKAGIIRAGQSAVGAKVEVKSAHLAILSGHVLVKGLTVGDRLHPFVNLAQAETIDLDLSTRALLSGQVFIQNVQVSGLAFGTARKTSAALKKPVPPKKKVNPRKLTKPELEAQKEVKQTVAYYSWEAIQSRLGLKALMDTSAFQFSETLNKTSKALSAWPETFQSQMNSPNVEEQVALIAKQWDALQKEVPTDILKVPDYLKQVQRLQAEVVSLNQLVQDKAQKINQATQYWHGQVVDLNRQAEKDLAALQDRIKRVQSMPSGAIKDILGDQYLTVIASIQDKIKMVQSKIKPKKPAWYQRFWVKGDDIVFPIYEHRPKFLIKHVQCDGVFGRQGDAFLGTIDEITLQQGIRNIPTTILFWTKEAQSPRQFSLKGVVDLRHGVRVAMSGDAKGLSVAKSYWDTTSIPFVVDKGAMRVQGEFAWASGQLSLASDIQAGGLVFSKTSSFRENDLFHELLAQVVANTAMVDLKVRFQNGLLSMDSNLDEALSMAMNRMIDIEKQKWMKLAAAQWDQLVGEPLRGVEKQFQQAKSDLDGQWTRERQKVDVQLRQIQTEIVAAKASAENQVKQSGKQAEEELSQTKRAEEAKAQKIIDEQKAAAQKALDEKVKGLKF